MRGIDLLGMSAYNAYSEHVGGVSVHGEPLPSWDEQRPEIREAWRAAATRVKHVLALAEETRG